MGQSVGEACQEIIISVQTALTIELRLVSVRLLLDLLIEIIQLLLLLLVELADDVDKGFGLFLLVRFEKLLYLRDAFRLRLVQDIHFLGE